MDELYLSASLEEIQAGDEQVGRGLLNESQKEAVMNDGDSTLKVKVTDELVTRARQTGANITFVEDGALLADVGVVGPTLRYQLNGHNAILVEAASAK